MRTTGRRLRAVTPGLDAVTPLRPVTPLRGAIIATYVFAVVMASTTLPTPLYAIYASRLQLKPFLTTVIFAVYAVGVIAALLLFGRLSDQVGRKPVLVVAVLCSAVSTAVFIVSSTLPALFTGRVLSGVSAGLITGAATAYISELHPLRRRGALFATLATMGGLGLGPLISGVFAEHAPDPTRLPYIVGAALLLPALLLFAVPDTVARRPHGLKAGVRFQRLGVPREIRVPFISAAIAGFVGFAFLGFVSALVGNFLSLGLADRSHQTAGLVAFLAFMAGAAGQLLAGGMSTRTASLTGLGVLPIGLVPLILALPAKSLPLFLLGVVVSGAGAGFAFRAAVLSVSELAPPARRGEIMSTLFVVSYIGIAVPAVGVGGLLTATTLLTATLILAVMLAALAAVAVAILLRRPAAA